MSLHVIVEGEGKPLVLFHGWGFDSHIWTPLCPILNQRYRLYRVDLPGFGLSAQMPWDHFKSTLLKQLPDEFAIAGWSMGGLMATRLALEAPSRVTHVMNIASSPRFIQDENWPGITPVVFSQFYNDLVENPLDTLTRFVSMQRVHEVSLKTTPNLDSLRAGLDVLLNWDFREHLYRLGKPVCYLFGQLDMITPRKIMTTMECIYPQFEYRIFTKAAHMPFLSHMHLFIELLDEFLI